MKFLRKINKNEKIAIVLSDLHLGAGYYINGQRNLLEDFFYDKELVNFFHYFSSGDYLDAEVEIILNGDFLDFLSTPYVNYYDDMFWSEEAAIEKMKIIKSAHLEVFIAINTFLKCKNKKFVYVVGNHDTEILLPGVQEKFLSFFSEDVREKIILPNSTDHYSPGKGIYITHGHQYERAHDFSPENIILTDAGGKKYVRPTWGSYYVSHIVNKFKLERSYINQIQPIKHFLIHGLLYDTFFTMRFMLANVYYFVMVRFWIFHLLRLDLKKILWDLKEELILFQNYETLTRKFFKENPETKVLLVGHTHHAALRDFQDGTTFVNTGTWTKIISLDFSYHFNGYYLTFAMLNIKKEDYDIKDFNKNVVINLFQWKGDHNLPFEVYQS